MFSITFTKSQAEQFLKNRAAPPRREPLPDEQIKQIHEDLCNSTSSNYKTMARAIEAALCQPQAVPASSHGITGGNNAK